MKKIISIAILSLTLFSCNKKENISQGYLITGTAKGVYDGVRMHLKTISENGNEFIKDTAIVFNEEFTFEGKIETPHIWYLSVNGVNGYVPFVIENKMMTLDFDKDDISGSKMKGTEANDALSKYSRDMLALNDKRLDLNKETRKLGSSPDSITLAKISSGLAGVNKEIARYPIDFIKSNSDNFFSLILLETLLKNNTIELNTIENTFDQLDEELKSSSLGLSVNTQIKVLKQENERANSLNIGKMAPEFSAPKADGQMLALNDIKGKVTIIDFWASWCGPCRRENPNVVNVYNKYHSKGLEIIGVSLDKPNQKDKWLKAIEDDKLTWHHVSNLQYFNDPVARLYNIKSIPATYILDNNGTIVAKNLRGPALEAKIAEFLN